MVRCRLIGLVVCLYGAGAAGAVCEGDFDGDMRVSISELVRAVDRSLNGCPPPDTATSTASPTATFTPSSTPTETDTPTETATQTPTATATPLPSCGDGHTDPLEECDEPDLDNQSCFDVTGEDFGQLRCTEDCRFDTTDCSVTRFTDNLDGSITDHSTGLVWEKKCATCAGLHDVGNRYPWAGRCSVGMGRCQTDRDCAAEESCDGADGQGTGLTIFEWIDQVNGEDFGNSAEWRVPTLSELESLRDLGTFDPAVDPIFHRSACADVTDARCSRTGSSNYWSATSHAKDADKAWDINFDEASVDSGDVFGDRFVRAVRGGR